MVEYGSRPTASPPKRNIITMKSHLYGIRQSVYETAKTQTLVFNISELFYKSKEKAIETNINTKKNFKQRNYLLNRNKKIQESFDFDQNIFVHNKKSHQPVEILIETLDDALNIQNHIILVGLEENINLAIRELKKPLISAQSSHKIVIFAPEHPSKHNKMKSQEDYKDVLFVKGDPKNIEEYKKLNIKNAFSIIIFSSYFVNHVEKSTDGDKNSADADLLFLYTYMTKSLPEKVFFSIELSNSYNLAVLNLKITKLLKKRKTKKENSSIPTYNPFIVRNTLRESESTKKQRNIKRKAANNEFWEFSRQPEALPIYASGKAFVASAFDSLIGQVMLYN